MRSWGLSKMFQGLEIVTFVLELGQSGPLLVHTKKNAPSLLANIKATNGILEIAAGCLL